jgi:hypothetical protein
VTSARNTVFKQPANRGVSVPSRTDTPLSQQYMPYRSSIQWKIYVLSSQIKLDRDLKYSWRVLALMNPMSRREWAESLLAGTLVHTSQAPKTYVVIGAGVFGAWTAYHLLAAGHKVILVDQYGPANSRASSGGETRIMRCSYGPDEIYTRMAQRSLALWSNFFAHTGRNLLQVQSDDDTFGPALAACAEFPPPEPDVPPKDEDCWDILDPDTGRPAELAGLTGEVGHLSSSEALNSSSKLATNTTTQARTWMMTILPTEPRWTVAVPTQSVALTIRTTACTRDPVT